MEEELHYPSVVEGEENLPHHLPELVAEGGREEFRQAVLANLMEMEPSGSMVLRVGNRAMPEGQWIPRVERMERQSLGPSRDREESMGARVHCRLEGEALWGTLEVQELRM